MNKLLVESNFNDIQVINEDTTFGKFWYIEGIFMQADVVNRNRRLYPGHIMEAEINNYQKNWIDTKRSAGELNHPNTMEINPERISHITEEIRIDGKNYIGRAKVLNTPTGKTVQGLLEGGVVVGVSSRASGSTRKLSNGVSQVLEDLSLRAIDVVFHPSAPDSYVVGLMEGETWTIPHTTLSTIEEDSEFVQNLRESLDHNRMYANQEAKYKAFQMMLEHFTTKRS